MANNEYRSGDHSLQCDLPTIDSIVVLIETSSSSSVSDVKIGVGGIEIVQTVGCTGEVGLRNMSAIKHAVLATPYDALGTAHAHTPSTEDVGLTKTLM